MRRLLFVLTLGLLIWDASGLDALAFEERCSAFTETTPDNDCPSTCVRCACGQPVLAPPVSTLALVSVETAIVNEVPITLPPSLPHDIFHVPKPISLTL